MENAVIELGFESLDEFHEMVANADISTQEKILKFKEWQLTDGSKEGLLNL